MTSSRRFRIAAAAAVRVAAIAAALLVIGRALPARADNLSELVRQLEDGDSDKVRLSAALNLTKLGDPRAILPLAKALGNDTDKTVRGAAAVGLGKLVTDKTDPKIRKAAISVLTQAKNADESEFVRGEADKALRAIGVGGSTPRVPQPSSGKAIYVNIGPMASNTGDSAVDARLKAVMVKVANKTMTRVSNGAGSVPLTFSAGEPSKAVFDPRSASGFYIDGTVEEMKVKETGSAMTVSCKINMLLASYPDRNIFGFPKGAASVQASGSKSEIALAREDCVAAVVEDLIAKRIVPTITSKVGP